MSTITLEIPDEIAAKVKLMPKDLSVLIKEALTNKLEKLNSSTASELSEPPVYKELVDLLSSAPTSQKFIDFKISDAAQDRLEDLLYRNREEELTQAEMTELETYIQLSHVITRLKARVRNGQTFLD